MALSTLVEPFLNFHIEKDLSITGLVDHSESESQSDESRDKRSSFSASQRHTQHASDLISTKSKSHFDYLSTTSDEESCMESQKKSANSPECQFVFSDEPLGVNRNKCQDTDIGHEFLQEYDTFENDPNFSKFIDVSALKVEDLPPVYRHTETLDMLSALADVVVKVSLTDKSGRIISGSGIVDDIMLSTDNDCVCPCMCDACSSLSVREWGSFSVVTSAKLTLGCADNITNFVCSLFYDSEDKINVQQLPGHKLLTYNKQKDLLIFTCVSDDMSLLRKIKHCRTTFANAWSTSFMKYYQTVKWEHEKIVFVVSHPYGLRRHLSIGNQLSRTDSDSGVEDQRVGYNLATCPGCIGAYVLVPDYDVVEDDLFDF